MRGTGRPAAQAPLPAAGPPAQPPLASARDAGAAADATPAPTRLPLFRGNPCPSGRNSFHPWNKAGLASHSGYVFAARVKAT